MNTKIENLIEKGEYDNLLEQIQVYENVCNDADINTYKFMYYYAIGEYQRGLIYAKKAVVMQPYIADVHYNCGYAYELNGYLYEAYEQYIITSEIISAGNKSSVELEVVIENSQTVLKRILESVENNDFVNDIQNHNWLQYIVNKNKYKFGIRCPEFHSGSDIIGSEYYDYPFLNRMYIGVTGLRSMFNLHCGVLKSDTINEKAELQRVDESRKRICVECNTDSFVPIIMSNKGKLIFNTNGEKKEVIYSSPYHYVNYRTPKGKFIISSENEFRIGELVPIIHDENRKKLVLNIFVDGLSQTVLENDFEKLMPHTYRFFKNGIQCTNAHTAGDWTFPSIASITTGQTLARHKMLHSKILRKIDEETPILFEYFKNAGYNTTKIGGNWRIAPNYGYARGMNRVKYQHMYAGYSVEQVVADVEEQIHCMADTDQFIWMEIGELHLIADEINMAPLQSELMVWENEEYSGKVNSVKQKYDETKIKYYKKQIEYIDRRLASLYQYIEDNYKDEEVVVSLFADHGQGYLVKPEEDFLCYERSNIAFMFRGGNVNGKSKEIISSCDYSGIMCKLAGIDYDYSKTDAFLPVTFGGSKEREFCVTESIHVGDPYEILLNGKDFKFYLKGKENVTSECRIPLDEFETRLLGSDGNEINDNDRIKRYTKWCLEHISSCRIFNN